MVSMCSVIDDLEDLDQLRCRETAWLEARHDELTRGIRRMHAEDLKVVAILDERGRSADALAARDGISVRAAREKVATARALESLPHVAAAAQSVSSPRSNWRRSRNSPTRLRMPN